MQWRPLPVAALACACFAAHSQGQPTSAAPPSPVDARLKETSLANVPSNAIVSRAFTHAKTDGTGTRYVAVCIEVQIPNNRLTNMIFDYTYSAGVPNLIRTVANVGGESYVKSSGAPERSSVSFKEYWNDLCVE